MSKYFPPYDNSCEKIKVELELSNYATKKDIKDITHVDTSSYALKTNLANLKIEVDKIDTDKLKTVPDDLAKLSKVVKNDVVKKTEFTTLKNKVDGIDTNNFVSRTKFEKDIKDLDDKISDVSALAIKSSVTYLITEAKDKIDKIDNKIPDISGLASKTELTAVENKIPDATGLVKKSDYATEITSIKNDYVTNASLDSKINDLKAQNIADEVKKVDDKTKKNASDILAFETRLKQKEDIVDESQREDSFTRGLFYYIDGANNNLPDLKSRGRMHVYFNGNYFTQNKVVIPNNNNVINIYCVYQLDPISSSRDTTYIIQNALFGAVEITRNADASKNAYRGYGICFDEGGTFGKGNINNGRNVMIFGVHESSLVHANNKTNNIFVIGDSFVQGINDTTLYAENLYSQTFTQPSKKFVLSLHYNGDDSYLFVNGKQELKFKSKTEHLLKEKLFLENLSDQWTIAEYRKTGLYGNIYDFVVDYEQIIGVGPIYDLHRYLMIKHNIM